jgi:hypothetical protein
MLIFFARYCPHPLAITLDIINLSFIASSQELFHEVLKDWTHNSQKQLVNNLN